MSEIKKPKKPTDATMRNIRAANKRIQALENRIRVFETIVYFDIAVLQKKLELLMTKQPSKRGRK